MDFSITEEQSMLQDSVAKFIENDYDFETRQKHAATEAGYSKEFWTSFGELGWTAVPFSEDDGGLDGGPVESMLIMEQFGRGLVLEPYLASVILAGGVLKRLATDEQKENFMAGVAEGSRIGALAFTEPQSRYRLADVALSATKEGDGYVLDGRKGFVIDGGSADFLVVTARTSGERQDETGISFFVLDANTKGIKVNAYPTVDGMRAAEIDFDKVVVGADALLGTEGNALAVLSDVIDEATLAVSSEALGIMEMLNHKTLDYTKNRVQFGMPIAAFQALQHRMVDMFVTYEQTKSLLLFAVMTMESGSTEERRSAVSAVKHQIGVAGTKLGQEAVQLHGGMGVTWELDVAHYFKRLTAIGNLFGNADYHLDRFADTQR